MPFYLTTFLVAVYFDLVVCVVQTYAYINIMTSHSCMFNIHDLTIEKWQEIIKLEKYSCNINIFSAHTLYLKNKIENLIEKNTRKKAFLLWLRSTSLWKVRLFQKKKKPVLCETLADCIKHLIKQTASIAHRISTITIKIHQHY